MLLLVVGIFVVSPLYRYQPAVSARDIAVIQFDLALEEDDFDLLSEVILTDDFFEESPVSSFESGTLKIFNDVDLIKGSLRQFVKEL